MIKNNNKFRDNFDSKINDKNNNRINIMEISNELLSNSSSNVSTVYQNIDYSHEQQFQSLINLNNSETKPQSQQLSHFQNTSNDNNRYSLILRYHSIYLSKIQ